MSDIVQRLSAWQDLATWANAGWDIPTEGTSKLRNAIKEAADEIERLRARVAEWQPIETAPKDGTEIWAYNGEQARMKWIEGDGYALWSWSDELLSDVNPDADQPTHWMPLPAAPAQKGGEG